MGIGGQTVGNRRIGLQTLARQNVLTTLLSLQKSFTSKVNASLLTRRADHGADEELRVVAVRTLG